MKAPVKAPVKAPAKKAAAAARRPRKPPMTYVTLWKDPASTKGGLFTYADGKNTAVRTEDEVTRATDPAPHVLQDTPEDRALLDTWLQAAPTAPTPTRYPYLAVPLPLVREVIGWDL